MTLFIKTLLAAGCLLASPILARSARAEGSADLITNGGDRPYLEYRNDSLGGIPRRTTIKVYANAGEFLNLASSARGVGVGAINYRDPAGNPGSCTVNGFIANRAQEVAKTYTHCTVPVGQTGIWEIDFVSPNPANTVDPPPTPVGSNWTQPGTRSYVSAWDVTVTTVADFASGGIPQNGRVYANYFPWNMGANGRSLNSDVVVLTDQGFQYSINLNGIDPFGFIFFANNKGFQDAGGEPIYRSLQFEGANPGTIPVGYSIHLPSSADTSDDVTHKLFINTPDSSMPVSANINGSTTWLYQAPIVPSPPSDVEFTGTSGNTGLAFTSPAGGNFTFTNNGTTGTYTIVLDINQNGVLGDGNDRILIGRATPGANTVPWDGLDGNGDAVSASDFAYQTELTTAYGETHFPMLDPESNANGFIIQRLSPTNNPPDPFNIYYDDSNTGADFTLCAQGETGSSCYGTASNPRAALLGTSSAGGGHGWDTNFGNIRGMDTWVNFPIFPVVEGSFTISDGTATTTTEIPGTLRMVKRITDITRNGSTLSGVDFSSFVDDTTTTNDNADGWSSLSPIGIINLPNTTPLRSGDEVEYTLYLLSDGAAALSGVDICDPVPQGTAFLRNTYASGRGILLRQGSTETSQTNNTLDGDEGKFFEALTPVAIAACPNANNPNGSVVIEGLSLPNTAPDNVGFIRFRVRVN